MPAIQINEQVLDNTLAKLESARAWSPRVISRLETVIRTADDYELFRINPIQYATVKGMAESEAIDLFLYGTKAGLFEMEWYVLCPGCAYIVQSLRDLSNLHAHFVCDQCWWERTVDLDDYIQVAFTVSRQIRELTFHHPESLPIEDFYLKYRISKGVLPFPNGQTFEDGLLALTKAGLYLGPGERKILEFEVAPGSLYVGNTSDRTGATFFINEDQRAEVQIVPLQFKGDKLQPADQVLPTMRTTIDPLFKPEHLGELTSGKVRIEVENLMDRKCPLWILNMPQNFDWGWRQFDPFLSGKRLLTTQTFRDLFRFETTPGTETIGVKDITFLFTDLKGSTELYDLIGDAQAFYLVRQHFDTLGQVIIRHSGAIVKTIGDAVMATFMTPVEALKAAIDMLKEIEDFNQSISKKLILKIGIHKGHSMVVTLNDHLDYFGQTVNIASRVQGLAGAGEIYISQDVYDYSGVSDILQICEMESEQVLVKGVRDKLRVYKVTIQR
jgi:class 3 adenylate cyclase